MQHLSANNNNNNNNNNNTETDRHKERQTVEQSAKEITKVLLPYLPKGFVFLYTVSKQ